MVNKVEAEITAMQADFAHRIAWLRGDYLPSPLPKVEQREAALAFAGTRDQESVPDEIVGRLIGGENPIRVWREHRGLSLRSLAGRVGTSPSALSDIETGKSEERLVVLRRIASVLDVTLDELGASSGRAPGEQN